MKKGLFILVFVFFMFAGLPAASAETVTEPALVPTSTFVIKSMSETVEVFKDDVEKNNLYNELLASDSINQFMVENIEKVADDLKAIGMPETTFENMTVYIFPVEILPEGFHNLKCDAEAFVLNYQDGRTEVFVATAYNEFDLRAILIHEFAHIFCGHQMNVKSYSWADCNELGKAYIQTRDGYSYDLATQNQLDFRYRLSEQFAEDFKFYAYYRLGTPVEDQVRFIQGYDIVNHDGVISYFDSVLAEGS